MSVTVQTGHTKSASGLSLVAENFQSGLEEDVVVLLQIYAASQDAKVLEKECMAIIKHALLETEGDAAERLDGTLKEINGLLKGLLVSQSIEDIHAILGIVDQHGVLHVSHAGRAEAYIVRAGGTSQITEYTKGKPTPAFVHIASGALEPRDTLVFSTQRLLRTVTPAQLAQFAQRNDQLMDELTMALEGEKEKAALAVLRMEGRATTKASKPLPERSSRRRQSAKGISSKITAALSALIEPLRRFTISIDWFGRLRAIPERLLKDLKNPQHRRRAHLLILASAVVVFLLVWAVTNLTTSSQRSQTRTELKELMEQIDTEIRTAENRHLTGDLDSANAILQRAEERAKQVINNENGLYRTEALDLLERIRMKGEEMNNITRLSPRVVVNLAAKSPDIAAMGVVGVGDGELVAYDRQDLYRVLLNSVDDPDRLTEEELILDGTYFERMQTLLFQTTGNSIIEVIADQPTDIKTEDPAGWITGKALTTYLRFLYVLSPENNQIYKYERLSNRYAPPAEYNINGDLSGALDFAIDGNVFVLKEGGQVVKLFRGEMRPFSIRHLPEGVLEKATKIFKVQEGNLYFLVPSLSRVVIVTDGAASGESSYVKQYILEGDQVGELVDFYVDPEELRLYVLDAKRVYSIDLGTR
ncbi:hypothetical protein COU80_01145 [Candidatus Peregrinibacteria bacterium CG10_big_fil_rev_8_21_14_0_10_55_24]|nr:MAG: hypothetical protein COU80_01145 [Candidatus Peregrinibacteria bacterium CG10_big_fil_rev_8_21_14_0_10_55_24]